MLRAYLYLIASGVIWLVEGFLFSHYLGFHVGQTVVLAVLYLALFGVATAFLIRALRNPPSGETELSPWRVVSVLPMVVVILGSFASLPLILLVAALGKLF